VFSLLMVNGGRGQHANSPYYPIPFAPGIVAGVPDSGIEHAQLIPVFTLDDGTRLMATAFTKDITESKVADGHAIKFSQDELNRVGQNQPVADNRIRVETEYRFQPGRVTRIDRYTPSKPLQLRDVSLTFATFSTGTSTQPDGAIRFGDGNVTRFAARGFTRCSASAAPDDPAFRTPTGAMRSVVVCRSSDLAFNAPITLEWTFDYRSSKDVVPDAQRKAPARTPATNTDTTNTKAK
jgi:hypothetical protein